MPKARKHTMETSLDDGHFRSNSRRDRDISMFTSGKCKTRQENLPSIGETELALASYVPKSVALIGCSKRYIQHGNATAGTSTRDVVLTISQITVAALNACDRGYNQSR